MVARPPDGRLHDPPLLMAFDCPYARGNVLEEVVDGQ
jgi:hypothetical protein